MSELKPNIITLLRRADEIDRVAKTMLDIYETDTRSNCKYKTDRTWKNTYIRVATYFKNKYFTDIMTASNEWGRICVFIEKYMEETGFKDRFIEIYNKKCGKIQESIRKVLREEMNKEVKWLVRRLEDPDILDDLDATVKSTAMFTKACGKTEDDFFDEVMENSIHNFINHWEELYEADDFLPIDDFVYRVIHEKYEDYIIEKYQSKMMWCD